MKSSTFFFVLLVIISPAMVVSATIEPSLEKQLSGAQQGEKLNVILALYNPRDIQALDQDLHFMHAGRVERYLTAYKALRANAAETQASVIKQIEAYELAGEIEYHKAYWIGNLIVVHGTAVTILNLANHPAVKSVGPNSSIALMDPVMRGPLRSSRPDHLDEEQTTPGQDAIHATQVNRELGITGQGVLVANCDTGVDGAHPALASRWRGTHAATSECWLSFAGNPNFPVDEWGHGTHVMGTICGREIDGNDTNTVGSAPNAEWIASDALMGSSLVQDILDTYEWFADPDGDPETMDDVPDVVQNSWRVFEDCYDEWNTVILNLEALGCVVTWSAGNEGPGAQSMGAPPELQFNPTQIFSVGAVDATGDPTPPYTIADFSSRGPSGCEPDPDAFKPEVVAPGVDVYSCVPGGDYAGGWSGTSMAGPHVAGCVALMREACPDCDPQTIKEAILNSCIDYGGAGDDNTYGMGFIDAYEAVLLVYNLGRVDGYITTSTGTPVGGARVQALDATHAVYSGANGYYNLSLPEGMHTIRYTKFGYETVTIENVEATEGDTVHIDVEMNQVPTGTLAGTVVTQVGIPIQNAIVVIQNAPIDTMISDAFGRIFVTLPATTYDVYLEMTVNTNPPTVYTANPTVTVQAEDTTFEDLEIFIDLIEPVGPDAYGYFAYDRYDRDLPAPADWIELDPEIGNPGVAFEFVHHDSALYFDAPFPLKFYGEWSEMLTVNPNGWMLPGYVTGPGAVNTPIPSNQNNDPPGIIAPFWDDMRIGLGARQFSYYDRENGRWIFEFLDQRVVAPNNRFHNWQVHFFDPARYASATGDVDIVVVYHLVQYLTGCTIGIESPDENTGVQIRYNMTVDSSAWPVEDGAAIRYTTGRAALTGWVDGTLTLYPSSPNITDAVLWIGGETTIPGVDGTFSAESVPAALVSMLLNLDGYEARRIADVVVPANGTVTQVMWAWRLDPPLNLSATQYNGVVTLRWNRPLSVQAMPNPEAVYLVYANGSLVGSTIDTVSSHTYQDGEIINFCVVTQYRYGISGPSDTLQIEVDLAADDALTGLPTQYALYQNYPNPFNPSTQVRLDVPETANASLMIYDITGRLVRTLYRGTISRGRYTFAWDSKNDQGAMLASGVYLYRFRTPQFTATEKMMLLR